QYAPTAVNCQNKLSDDNCKKFYNTSVAIKTSAERPEACWKKQNGSEVDPQLVQMAVDNCPRTCGYCCLTPEYNCENKAVPRVSCSSISVSMCSDPTWRTILAEDCPKTCGLCNQNTDCTDTIPGCNRDPTICRNVALQDFVKANCKKTCGLCQSASTTSPISKLTN
ncbi:shTK domain protein, partial [Dictyocaulus viviparus]